MPPGLRIESDGTAEGTHVYLDDAEVLNVTQVTWNFSPSRKRTSVTMEISNVELRAKANDANADDLREAIRRSQPPLDG